MPRQISSFARQAVIAGVLLMLFGMCLWLAIRAPSSSNSFEITTVAEFLRPPPPQSPARQPVRIKAVVTYADPEGNSVFVQDSTGGCYVNPTLPRLGIEAGELVQIEGTRSTRSATNSAHGLMDISVRELGRGEWPRAIPVDASALMTRNFSMRLIEIHGTVRSFNEYGRLGLVLVSGGERFRVFIRHYRPSDLEGLLDAQVVVQGVCEQRIGRDGLIVSALLLVAEFRSLRIVQLGPADPFAGEATPINKAISFGKNPPNPQRIRIQGYVLSQNLGALLRVRDGTGQIAVWSKQRIALAKDDRIDAVGFPDMEKGEIVLSDAQFRLVESSPAASATAAQADSTLPALRTIKEILDLTKQQSRQLYPVKVKGVVTHFDDYWKQLFIQDGKDGIYVNVGNQSFPIKTGQLVEVSGVTMPGGVLTMISPAKVEVLGIGTMPDAASINYQQAITGDYDCRLVKVEGTVQSVDLYDDHLYLDLVAADGHFQCTIPRIKGSVLESNLLNAVVQVKSACVVNVNNYGTPISITLPIDGEKDITISETAPVDEFSVPAQRIGDILRFIPPRSASRRMKVAGAVTLFRPGREIFVQDGTGSIRALSTQTNLVNLGDEVEVAGFRTLDELTPMLRNADFRVLRKGLEPAPKKLDPSAALSVTNHGDLVEIQARLMESISASTSPELVLIDGPVMFTASAEPSETGRLFPALAASSLVRITGICYLKADETRQPRSFRVIVRTPADITVVQKPLWLTGSRALWLAAFLVATVAAALMWIGALQSRVRHQTVLIRQRLEREASLEERCRELVEHANDAIFTYDLDSRLLSINEAGERVLGYRRSEALRMKLTELVAPEHHARLQELMRDGATKPIEGTYELMFNTKDGRRLVLELSTRALKSSGRVTGFETIARDVTGRKLAEEQLRTSEARLAEAQRIGHVGSWDYSLSNRKLSLSAEACRLLELDQASGPGILTALSRIHGADRKLFLDALKRTLHGGFAFSLDHRLRLPRDVERVVHSRVETGVNAKGECVRLYGTIEDVSERRALEIQLRQAQKMESIGQLAAGVAHDFNNLLTVIQGNTSLLISDPRLPTDSLESLSQIASSSQRAADLTRQLLAFSRKQFIQPRIVDLNDVVSSTAKMLERVLGEHIQLQIQYTQLLPTVKADPGMIGQVIMNLAVNARDAMPNGGRLEISTRLVNLSAGEARNLADGRPGSFVCLHVQDTGSGMSQATVEHLFEPFFTTKDIGKGTGLGLSTVYGIVKQHEGMIEVASKPGEGTTFNVYLPVHGAPKDPSLTVPAQAPATRSHGTVLIVEDESALRTLAVRVLHQHGWEAFSAASGKEAIEIWAQHSKEIDILLTDMVMPDGISGGELAKQLRAQKTMLQVIYTSGYSPELLNPGVEIEEGVNFLSKPYLPSKLIRTLQNCFEKRAS